MASTTASQTILTRQSTPNQSRTSISTVYHRFRFLVLLATRASGPHPFPFRTRSLSLTAPMVLRSRDRGRVGRRRRLCESPSALRALGLSCLHYTRHPAMPRFLPCSLRMRNALFLGSLGLLGLEHVRR